MSKEKENDNKMTVEKIKHLHDIIAEVIGCDTTVRDEGICCMKLVSLKP